MHIRIGNFSFNAHKFNLGETEEIVELQDGMGSATTRVRLSAMRGIVLIAARRENPDLTDDDMRKIEASPSELIQAVNSILRLNGYVKEAAAGNEPAADQAA